MNIYDRPTPETDAAEESVIIGGVGLMVPVEYARRLEQQRDAAVEALEVIAGGHTDRLIGAPDPMNATSPQAFRAEMWTSSQITAREVLRALKT